MIKTKMRRVSYKDMFKNSVQHFENPQFFNLSCFKIYTTTLYSCQLVKSMKFVQRTGTYKYDLVLNTEINLRSYNSYFPQILSKNHKPKRVYKT